MAAKRHEIIRYSGNRRLYDTLTQRYSSLVEVKRIIQEGGSVRITAKDGGADITQYVLLGILAEEAWAGVQFSEGVLVSWIRQLPSMPTAASA